MKVTLKIKIKAMIKLRVRSFSEANVIHLFIQ